MIRRFVIRPEAEAEMTEAFDWYEERLPGLGASFLLRIYAVFRGIVRDPQRWPPSGLFRDSFDAILGPFPHHAGSAGLLLPLAPARPALAGVDWSVVERVVLITGDFGLVCGG